MKKKAITEVVFILDRSGSMAGLESDTIGGYNALLEKQLAQEGEVRLPQYCSIIAMKSFTIENHYHW